LRRHLAQETNLYSFGTFGINISKPPQVLAILVNGVEPFVPRVYNLALYTLPEPQGSMASENPTAAVFGALDLSFIVEVVLGLGALLFTFATICGEKEVGTLKLQLANALPKDILLLGKLVGNLLGLLVPVAVAFLLGCILLVNFADLAFNAETVGRLVLIGLAFLMYLTVMFALGMLISVLTTRTTTAFALCLATWVFLVALVPKAAVLAAKRIAPEQSLQDFEMKRVDVHRRGTVEAQEELRKYLLTHNRQVPPAGVYENLTKRVREKQNRELRQLAELYTQRQERQARVAVMLSRLSPASSASYAVMRLAQTGLERELRFRAALREYRVEFTTYHDRKSDELVVLSENRGTDSSDLRQSFADLPPFRFYEEPFSASLNGALPDLGFLGVWALVLFLAAYIRFIRYEVR